MFTKGNSIVTNKQEISNYMEGLDLYNSKFLYEVTNPNYTRVAYEITVYEYRPDLIANDFYGDSGYEGIVMLQAKKLENLKRGGKILLLPKITIDRIIGNL